MQDKTEEREFQKSLVRIALPVTLQSLLQASFSIIDQIMIGQLGSASIAGIGLAGKFASLYSVMLGAVTAAAGIMMAQYIGQKNEKALGSSFGRSMAISLVTAIVFTLMCVLFPSGIMSLYTNDAKTCENAAVYLRIYACSLVPMAVTSIVSVLLRCMEKATLPLTAGILSVAVNTVLNYILIFGKCGFSPMGVKGAAAASVIAQAGACVLTLLLFFGSMAKAKLHISISLKSNGQSAKQYISILAPVLVCEFLWSVGENIYAAIYGNIGTDSCAAMTMTGPVQGMMIGALCGLSQAAGILIGKSLGSREYDKAYRDSKSLMKYGLLGALLLSLFLVLLSERYVMIYNVTNEVRELCVKILMVYALIAPIKVCNMILGGGIIRSGGRTRYVMWIDIIGTWIFGVPLGLLAAFALKLSIPYVYFMLSLEEGVRLLISLVIFRRKSWMESLE